MSAPEPRPCYYGEYLQLDRLLDCQMPETRRLGREAHDEMLFVVVHQAYELWFKQILHELDRIQADFAAAPLDDRRLGRIAQSAKRIHEIFKLGVQQLDVLETMTPLDFLDFRDVLYPASGFQSTQFRIIEARMGLPNRERLLFEDKPVDARLSEGDRARLREAASGPSLSDQLSVWLARTPFVKSSGFAFRDAFRGAVETMLRADQARLRASTTVSEDQRAIEARAIEQALGNFHAIFGEGEGDAGWRMSLEAVQAALFITLYRDEPVLQTPFRLLEALMDIDATMTLWRYRHALMVERMLGVKIGTGGSSGHEYLRATAAKHRCFPDLFRLSTYLIPRSALPTLPEDIGRAMDFVYARGTGATR
jgi:tryptophan 2,3-dioxygenase